MGKCKPFKFAVMTPTAIKKKIEALNAPGFGQVLVDALNVFKTEERFAEDIPLFAKHVITLLEAKYRQELPKKKPIVKQGDLEDLIKEMKRGK